MISIQVKLSPYYPLIGLLLGTLGDLGCSNASQIALPGSESNAVGASTSSDESSGTDRADPDESIETEATDEPQWVNAAFLNCTWDSILPDEQLTFGCALMLPGGIAVIPERPLEWSTKHAITGLPVGASMSPLNALATQFNIKMNATTVESLSMAMIIPRSPAAAITTNLRPLLLGLESGGSLGACLTAGNNPVECFASANVPIQVKVPSPDAQPVAPVRVIGLALGGSLWSAPSFEMLVGPSAPQLAAWPFLGIDRLIVKFSGATQTEGLMPTITGVNVPSYTVTNKSYEDTTHTWTLTLSSPILDDRLRLKINAEPTVPFDGEWTNPSGFSDANGKAWPSGDGSEGGAFNFKFNVLRGNTSRTDDLTNNVLSPLDALLIVNATNNATYDRALDLNSDGSLTATDGQFVVDRLSSAIVDPISLPVGEPP